MQKQLILEVLLNVTFISITIVFLFFTYGKYIEKKIVEKQATQLSTELNMQFDYLIPTDIKSEIARNLSVPDYSSQDNAVALSNKSLLLKSFYILSAVFLVGLICSYYISKSYNLDFGASLKSATILTVFVAFTEMSFLTFIGQYYMTVDPNYVKLCLLQSLQENLAT